MLTRLFLRAALIVIVALVPFLAAQEPLPPAVVTSFKGHGEPVYAIAFTPDGKQVVTGSFDKTLKAWDAVTGKELKTFAGPQGHTGLILCLALSTDGSLLASGSTDNNARIWDYPTSHAVRQFAGSDSFTSVAVTADGTKTAGASKDGLIRLWNNADGKELFKFAGHAGPITGLGFSPNGQTLVSAGSDRTIRIWNPADGKAGAVIGAHARPVTGLLVSPAGNAIVSSGEEGTVKFWTMQPVASRPLAAAHPDGVTAVTLSGDQNTIATACADKQVRLWTFANGQLLRSLTGPKTAVKSIAYAPNNAFVAGGTAENTLFLWNAADGKILSESLAHSGSVNALAVSANATQVLSGGGDGLLKVWTLPAVPNRVLTHPDAVSALAVSTDGKRIFTTSADKGVQAWNIAAPQQPERKFTGLTTAADALAASPDGNLLAAGGADKTVIIWTTADGKEVKKFTLPAAVHSVAFSPDAKIVAAGLADNTIHLLEVMSGKDVKTLTGHTGPIMALLYTPAGLLVSGSADKSIRIWDATGVFKLKLDHRGPVTALALSRDGAKIAFIGSDKSLDIWPVPADAKADVKAVSYPLPAVPTAVAISPNGLRVAVALPSGTVGEVRVLDALTGKEIQTFADHVGAVRGLTFLADNRTLVTAGADKTVRLLDVNVQAAWEAHPGGVTSVAYHTNATQALSGGADKKVVLWDLATGKSARSFGPLADPVAAVALSRDSTLAGAAAGKVVKIWNVADGKDTLTLTHPADVLSLSLSQDKTKLVTGGADNLARVWDLATGQELQFFAHTGPVTGVIFHTNNLNVVTGSADKTASVHTIAATRLLAVGSPVRALAMTPSASHVLTGSDDKAIKVWNAGSGAMERTITGAEGPVRALAVSKNNLLLAAGGADGLRLYQFADGKALSTTPTPGAVQALSFSPNNLSVAAACANNTVQLFSTAFNAGQPVPPEFGRAGQSYTLAGPAADVVFGPDNATLYAAGADKAVLLFRAAAENPIKTFGHPANVDAVAFNKEGTILATGAHDGKVRFFDVAKGTLLKETPATMVGTPPTPVNVYCLTWSPDNKTVISGSYPDNVARQWDSVTGAMVREFKGPPLKEGDKGQNDGIFCVAISPDGKTLAAGSSNRTIRLWNIADGSLLKELANPNLKPTAGKPAPSHPGWVYGVRFTQDGKFLVSAGMAPRNQGYLALWNVADGTLVAGEELPLGSFFGLALSPDGKIAAIGTSNRAGTTGNTSYLIKVPGVK